MKEYEIDFDGYVKCVIQIKDGIFKVTKAMNGYGVGIRIEDIKIEVIGNIHNRKEETK